MAATRCFAVIALICEMLKLVNMETKLITAAEAAESLGYDRTHITRLANAGKIKGQKIGTGKTSAWVFTPAAIREAKKRLGGKAA